MEFLSRRCEVCGTYLGRFDRSCKCCAVMGAEATRLSRWCPRVGEVAARFDLKKPRRALGVGLVVERGQAAILSLAGRVAVTLQPGPYRFSEGMLKDAVSLGAAGRMALTFVVTSDIELRFAFEDLLTRDHLPVSGSGSMVVRVARPTVFVGSVLRTRMRVTERDVCEALSRPVTDALADFAGGMGAFELDSGLLAKQKLASVLERDLTPTLDAHGLEFVALRAAEFRQEGLLLERKALGEALLAERRLEIMKRRVATWEQMSQLAARVAAAEARNAEQVAEIRRCLQHRLQDQELVRQQMREKMELEHQLDLARLRSEWAGPEAGPTAVRAAHSLRRATQAYAQAASATGPGNRG